MEDDKSLLRGFLQYKHETQHRNAVEIYVWAGVSLLPLSWQFLKTGVLPEATFSPISFIDTLPWLVAGILFPVVYRLIFSFYPLTHLRLIVKGVKTLGDFSINDVEASLADPKEASTTAALLERFANSSGRLAKQIYTRASAYLLVGVTFAISGLIFFYFSAPGYADLTSMSAAGADVEEIILSEVVSRVPVFGILFFIEVIAFFFLRQHRAAMDEFRYYESIQRHREENLILLKLIEKESSPVSALEIIKGSSFYSGTSKLAAGETTDLLESKKLDKGELDFLAKVIDSIVSLRK